MARGHVGFLAFAVLVAGAWSVTTAAAAPTPTPVPRATTSATPSPSASASPSPSASPSATPSPSASSAPGMLASSGPYWPGDDIRIWGWGCRTSTGSVAAVHAAVVGPGGVVVAQADFPRNGYPGRPNEPNAGWSLWPVTLSGTAPLGGYQVTARCLADAGAFDYPPIAVQVVAASIPPLVVSPRAVHPGDRIALSSTCVAANGQLQGGFTINAEGPLTFGLGGREPVDSATGAWALVAAIPTNPAPPPGEYQVVGVCGHGPQGFDPDYHYAPVTIQVLAPGQTSASQQPAELPFTGVPLLGLLAAALALVAGGTALVARAR